MNFLSRARAIAAELLPFSHNSSRKSVVVLYPIAVLQQSSVYSSSSNRLKSTQQRSSVPKPKTQPPAQPPEQSYSLPPLGFPEAQKKQGVDWPRPSEIPWQAKVANSVNLIGHVQIPVLVQATPDGNYWAGTVISQQDATSPDSPPSFWWVNQNLTQREGGMRCTSFVSDGGTGIHDILNHWGG